MATQCMTWSDAGDVSPVNSGAAEACSDTSSFCSIKHEYMYVKLINNNNQNINNSNNCQLDCCFSLYHDLWHPSLPLMNSFNKTEVAIFPCRLCFLRAFHFISLILPTPTVLHRLHYITSNNWKNNICSVILHVQCPLFSLVMST